MDAQSEWYRMHVRKNGEWAYAYIEEGTTAGYHWCVLTIQSTYGTVGHVWTSMGGPAAEFLPRLSKDYVLGKLWGDRSELFDYDATVQALKGKVMDRLMEEQADSSRVEAAVQAVAELTHCTNRDAFYAQAGLPITEVVDYGDMPIKTRFNPQAHGFWDALWPELLAQFKDAYARRHPKCDLCGGALSTGWHRDADKHAPGCPNIVIPF